MPFGSEGAQDGLGLALSGGGFRATLFHVGALKRLVEIGALQGVTRISSVSGGSIVAGRLAQVWTVFAADPTPGTYDDLVAKPLRAFCRRHVDAIAIGKGLFSPFSTASDEIRKLYAEHLMPGSLADLPDSPTFVFNSTNMQTGRSFRFTKAYMGDYRLGLIRRPDLPISFAVAASSAFPPFLSPVTLERHSAFERVEGADLHDDERFTGRLLLADGGVYDNLGLETVWNRCRTVLASDAGAPFAVGPATERDWLHQTMRALDVATDQSRALRKRALVADLEAKLREGCYWGIDTQIENYGQADALRCDPAAVLPLASIRTRLDPFDEEEQGRLVNWGYALADAAVRRHAPQLVASPALPSWPEPAFALG